MRNKIIGIIGDASIQDNKEYELAFSVGKNLIDNGYIIASGGLGGVMEVSSKGARASSKYDGKSIIAVLPDYNADSANIYSDVVLPLGNGISRNVNLISICDAVVAIGGGAGTLSELAVAWQMGKLIISAGDFGWSGKIKNTKIDTRRDDYIYSADTGDDVVSILNEKLHIYTKIYKGISSNFTADAAIQIIKSKYPNEEFKFLGKGKSGIVIGNKSQIYKVFFDTSFELKSYLEAICRKLSAVGINCKIETIANKTVLISNIYGTELKKSETMFSEDDFISAINLYYFAGFVCTDIKPENFIATEDKKLILFDIDKDVIPYTQDFFEIACRETFAIFKLQKYLKDNPCVKFKKIIGNLQVKEDFSAIEKLLGEDNLQNEYRHFRNKCGQFAVYKKLIYKYFNENIHEPSVFDYGAGTLEIAAHLKSMHFSISAYDIDENAFKEKYGNGIDCFTDSEKLKEYLDTKKFNTVLCSLVLCCVDDVTAIRIVENCKKLAKDRIVFVICNPLYASAESDIQIRNFNSYYSDRIKYDKKMKSTGNFRTEYQRTLGFYETLFLSTGDFYMEHIVQSNDSSSNFLSINNSDFMLISLRRVEK